jgi:intracellular septation protein
MTIDVTKPARPKELSGWTKAAVDFLPLALFFGANWWFGKKDVFNPLGGKPIIAATAVFMAALLVSMIYCWHKTRHISPMMWFTGIIVGVFGGLTIWLKDDIFIKLRPTIVNSLLGMVLLGGHWLGHSPLKMLFGSAFPPLTTRGWTLFTYAWATFFFFSAGLNEVLRRVLSDNAYVAYTSWGDILLTFGFIFACMPLILRHEDKSAES